MARKFGSKKHQKAYKYVLRFGEDAEMHPIWQALWECHCKGIMGWVPYYGENYGFASYPVIFPVRSRPADGCSLFFSFAWSFVCSFVHPFIHSFCQFCTHLLVYSFTPSLTAHTHTHGCISYLIMSFVISHIMNIYIHNPFNSCQIISLKVPVLRSQ